MRPAALAEATPKGALLLDFDGTLAPFRRDPAAVRLGARAREALAELAGARTVAVVSGRPLGFLREATAGLAVVRFGSHGGECDDPAFAPPPPPAVPRAALRAFDAAAAEGLRVERKPYGLVLHFRELPAAARAPAARRWAPRLAAATPPGWALRPGKLVLELRPRGYHKGLAVAPLRRRAGNVAAALGDDLTDEDMFRALSAGELGVLVGAARPSAARYRLAGVAAVGAYLAALARREARR